MSLTKQKTYQYLLILYRLIFRSKLFLCWFEKYFVIPYRVPHTIFPFVDRTTCIVLSSGNIHVSYETQHLYVFGFYIFFFRFYWNFTFIFRTTWQTFERIELLFPWQSPGVNYRFPEESHRFKILLRVVSLIHRQNDMSPRFMLFSSRLWFRFWPQTTETHSDLNWSPQQQRKIHNHIMQCSFTIMYVLTNTCPNKI